MKGLKSSELAVLNLEQIEKQVNDYSSRLVSLRFQKSVGQLDNVAQISTIRRDIARMLTELRARKGNG